MITYCKTDRYLNNFQEHLFGLQMSLQISFPRENEAVKQDVVEFKVQCLEVFGCHNNKSIILLFNSNFRTTPEIHSKLYFAEISLREVMGF